jgi:hypothetical protein
MLKIERTVLPSPEQWEIIIEGMRNPMNSWHLSDSLVAYDGAFILGENDHRLMTNLAKGGAVHAKYRRMIPVFLTIDAPLYWWKEFDTYKVGTVANSCSTMHKIHAKEFTLDDFSHEHLCNPALEFLKHTLTALNFYRELYLDGSRHAEYAMTAKDVWWQMIQLLPTSYNQKRTVMLNYEVLVNIYHSRKNHKLDEWHVFCDWIKQLPYSELITGGDLCV